MKCISLWQPWAHLMAIGAKKIETRSWATKYRGLLAIHASKKWTRELHNQCFEPPFLRAMRQNEGDADDKMIERIKRECGCVVAVVRLWGCWRVERIERADANQTPELDAKVAATLRFAGHSEAAIQDALKPMLTAQERVFGNYAPDRFGWLTESSMLKRLVTPVPCLGRQGIVNLPADVEAAVMAQIGGAA